MSNIIVSSFPRVNCSKLPEFVGKVVILIGLVELTAGGDDSSFIVTASVSLKPNDAYLIYELRNIY